jgi:hypothetical protein
LRQNNIRKLLRAHSSSQFKNYVSYHRYTEADLSQNTLYMSDEFVAFAKTCPGYETAITALYNQFNTTGLKDFFYKAIGFFEGTYCIGLLKRIKQLYQELQDAKNTFSSQQNITDTFYIPQQSNYTCQQKIIRLLESKRDKESVVSEIDTISQQLIRSIEKHNLVVDTQVEDALDISIDILKMTNNPEEFVFHTIFIDHVLCDVEDQLSSTTDQKPTLLERSPELLKRALTTFVKGLNPVTQIQNTYDFLKSTACFVADVTVGKFYLSEQEYRGRIDGFFATCAALSPSNLAKLEAEQWVEIVAQLAADCVFFGGVGKAVAYLKEIAAVSKAQQSVARIAQRFKNAVDISLSEHPIMVTAEGIIFRSDKMKQLGGTAKEVISNSRKLLESARAGLLADLEKEMASLRALFDGKKKGFAACANKYLKLDYEHIFGIELWFNRKGKAQVDGFYLDFLGAIEKSGVIKFAHKKIYTAGFYKADLVIDGAIITKTFFPSAWTREKVISKIYEACENFIKNGGIPELGKDGKYIIKSYIEEGIEIKMCITQKGKILTAYPILK